MGDIGDFIQLPVGEKDQFDRELRRCMIISLLNEIQKDPHRLDKRLISFGRIAGRKISAVITLENAALPFQMGEIKSTSGLNDNCFLSSASSSSLP